MFGFKDVNCVASPSRLSFMALLKAGPHLNLRLEWDHFALGQSRRNSKWQVLVLQGRCPVIVARRVGYSLIPSSHFVYLHNWVSQDGFLRLGVGG